MFACEHEGLVPDLITTAKALAGGMPLAPSPAGPRSWTPSHPGGLGGTYAGNPVACAAALAAIDAIEREDLRAPRPRDRGARAAASGARCADRHRSVGDVARPRAPCWPSSSSGPARRCPIPTPPRRSPRRPQRGCPRADLRHLRQRDPAAAAAGDHRRPLDDALCVIERAVDAHRVDERHVSHDPRTGAAVARTPTRYARPGARLSSTRRGRGGSRVVAAASPRRGATWLVRGRRRPRGSRDRRRAGAARRPRDRARRGAAHGELVRRADQLRFYGDVAARGRTSARRSTSPTDTTPDLRRVQAPLGPVAVFGASNFPFAFGVLGNDTGVGDRRRVPGRRQGPPGPSADQSRGSPRSPSPRSARRRGARRYVRAGRGLRGGRGPGARPRGRGRRLHRFPARAAWRCGGWPSSGTSSSPSTPRWAPSTRS